MIWGAEEYRATVAGYMPIKKYSNKIYPSRTSQLASGVDTRLTLYWDPFFDFTQDEHAIENFRWEYNHYRPHSALNDLTPKEFVNLQLTKPETPLLTV